MQVDEPRRDELAGGIEHPLRPRGRDVGLERLDDAVADADVALGAERLARVEHFATLHHEIELVVRPHGGAGPADHSRSRR
jgi:hypothetical protein